MSIELSAARTAVMEYAFDTEEAFVYTRMMEFFPYTLRFISLAWSGLILGKIAKAYGLRMPAPKEPLSLADGNQFLVESSRFDMLMQGCAGDGSRIPVVAKKTDKGFLWSMPNLGKSLLFGRINSWTYANLFEVDELSADMNHASVSYPLQAMNPDFFKEVLSLLGEEFFTIDKPYSKEVPVKDIAALVASTQQATLESVADWHNDGLYAFGLHDMDVDQALSDYPEFLRKHFKAFLIQRPPFTRSDAEFSHDVDVDGKTTKMFLTSLKDVRKYCPEREYEYIACTLEVAYDTKVSGLMLMPTAVAEFCTQTPANKLDVSHVGRYVIDRFEHEVVNFDYVNTYCHTQLSAIRELNRTVKSKTPVRPGTDAKTGLGMDARGVPFYLPVDMDTLDDYEKRQSSIAINNPDGYYYVWDAQDIPKNYAVVNKTVQERPRPSLDAGANTLLYVDWRNRVVCYTDSTGSLRAEEIGDYRPVNLKALRLWLEYPCLSLPNLLPTRYRGMIEHFNHLLATRLVKTLESYFTVQDLQEHLKVGDNEVPEWIAASFISDIHNACKSNRYAQLGDIAVRILGRKISMYQQAEIEPPENEQAAWYDVKQGMHTAGIHMRHIHDDSGFYVCRTIHRALMDAYKVWKTKFVDFTKSRAVLPACTEFALLTIIARYSAKYGDIVQGLAKNPTSLPVPDKGYTPKPLAGLQSDYTSQPHQARTDFQLNSLPPDTDVILNVAAGGGKCVVGSTLIPSSKGLLSIREQFEDCGTDLVDGYKEDVFGVYSTEGVVKTSHVYTTEGTTLKATFQNGMHIEGLPEHKLLNWNNGNVNFVPLGDTAIGDWIVRGNKTELYGDSLSLPSLNGSEMVLTTALAELLGWIVSEGYVPSKTELLEIEQHDADNRVRIANLYKELFGENPFVYGNSIRVVNVEVRAWLRQLLQGLGHSKDRVIPKCIRVAPKDYQTAFLRSLYEGDGSIYISNKGSTKSPRFGGYTLEYATTSKILAYQLQAMLENMGMTTYCIKSKSYHSAYVGKTRSYKVHIENHSHRCFGQIGFISQRKQSILVQAIGYYDNLCSGSQDSNRFVFGIDNALPCGRQIVDAYNLLYQIASQYTYIVATGTGHRAVAWTRRSIHALLGVSEGKICREDGSTTRFHAIRFLEVLRALPQEVADALKSSTEFMQLFDMIKVANSHKWIKVADVKKRKLQQVYDLVVPGPHNYVANGVMSHNTHLIWMDVARKKEANQIVRPLVLCPGYLMKNYIEDGQYMFQGRYNIVCIDNANTKSYKPSKGEDVLGLDGIVDMVLACPKNTLFVASYDFLYKATPTALIYGNILVNHNPNIEALIECGFDYVISDESHELRNTGSGKHREAAVLYAQSKWRGLASGTLLNTRPEDLPNQMKLINPAVFGTTDNFIEEYADSASGGKVLSLRPGAKEMIVDKMRRNTRYIQVKRKEWAALLPKRKDQWHILSMPEDSIYRVLYDTVLKQVMEEINKLLEKNREVAEAMGKSASLSDSTDEDEWKITKLLDPYLQRLEKLLIAPHQDPDFAKIVGSAGIGVSPKILKTIQICEGHIFGKTLSEIQDYNKLNAGSGLEVDISDEVLEDGGIKKQPGKIMVFCSYQACVDAVYEALPDNLKAMAVNYKATNKDKDILEFTTNDKKRILIGIGTSLATGHNFQMCTRIIRLESVWSPGELEQSESRINRPELKNASAARTSIFYDWVALNGTIDCSKLSRLTSRMLTNILIEEIDNPAYANVQQLPLISMNLDAIREVAWVALPGTEAYEKLGTRNLYNYIVELHKIREIQKAEYQEFRDSPMGQLKPIKIDGAEMPGDSALVLGIPPIPGQNYANSKSLGLVRFAEYVNQQDKGNLNALAEYDCVGLKVMTAEGMGEILSHTSITVLVDINGLKMRFDKLTVSVVTDPSVDMPNYLQAVGLNKVQYRDGKDITAMYPIGKKAKKQPAIEPIKLLPSKVVKPVPHAPEEDEPNGGINLYAQVYNGMLSVAVDLDDADIDDDGVASLEDLGFQYVPESYYMEIPNYKAFESVLTKLEAGWQITAKTLKLLWHYEQYFSEGRAKLFNADAEIEDVFDYYRTPNRKIKAGFLKPAFVVENGTLFLMIDAENHTDAAKVRRIKVAGTSWEVQAGSLRAVFPSKSEAAKTLSKVKKLFAVLNEDEFKADVKQIRV